MKGVQYFVDDQGVRRTALVDLDELGELWEDFVDSALIAERKDEPRRDFSEAIKDIETKRP